MEKVQVVDFATERGLTHSGILTISNPDEAQRLYTKFKLEQSRGTLAARLHTIPGAQRNVQVKWFINKALDPNENWNAFVLRNLRRGSLVEDVQKLVSEPVLRIERPREVQGTWCTLVVMKNVEDCERMCLSLNRKHLPSGERIKAHIHPHSRFFRRPANSHHRIFNTSLGLAKRPRLKTSSSTGPKKTQKKADDLKNLFAQIVKAVNRPSNGLNTNPLAELVRNKPVEQTLEEGEIHETFQETDEHAHSENYRLFELEGISCTWNAGIVRHSGMYIKTSHANHITESPK